MKGTGKRAIIYTLNVYKEGRAQLLGDTRNKASGLYLGLYSLKVTERENFLDRYLILWIISHMETFQRFMKNVPEPDCHRLVFARSYLKFLEYDGYHFYNTQLAVGMLKEYQKILEDMINTSKLWDQGYDKLCAEQKRQEMKFAQLRKEMEQGNQTAKEHVI